MTEQQLNRLLSQKTQPAPRENVSCVLAPDISRNAARLKKRRRDRLQLILCLLAGLLFIALTVGLMLWLRAAVNPELILRRAVYLLLSGMAATLLLSPVLAWYSEQES